MAEKETPATEDALQKAIAMLVYAAARRGLYLTVHALTKAEEVLKWELAGERDKALAKLKGGEPERLAVHFETSHQNGVSAGAGRDAV